MAESTHRDENDTDQPDSYWRRRVITLAAGMTLLAVLAWAFSGSSGKPAGPAPRSSQASGISPAAAYGSAPASSSAGADGNAQAGQAASGQAASGQAAPGQPASGQAASGLPSSPAAQTSGAGPSAGGKGGNGGKPAAGGRSAAGKSAVREAPLGRATIPALAGTPGGGAQPGGGCAPGAVVLSLFTTRPAYDGRQYPEFEIYAVSTGSAACSFDIGPGKLHLVVTSAGRIIWDSADCVRGTPDRVIRLRRGVPAQESIAWNRTITLPGCVTLASSARPGTYRVQARTATVASPVRTFKLER